MIFVSTPRIPEEKGRSGWGYLSLVGGAMGWAGLTYDMRGGQG